MRYTLEEKAKIDAVLQAFQSYVDGQEDYDVLYSKKAGYLRVLTGESCDTIYFPITGFADLVRMLTEDCLHEKTGGSLDRHTEQTYNLVRSQLAPILDTLGDYRKEAYQAMEDTLDEDRRHSIHCQEQIEEIIAHYNQLRAGIFKNRESQE